MPYTPPSTGGTGDALTTNPLSQFAATTSLQLKGVLSDETGSGAAVFATSPTLVTPILGVPTSGTLTNCTIPTAGVSDLGTGVGTFLVTPSGANLASALTTALPATKGGTGVTSLGTGVATSLGVNNNAAGGYAPIDGTATLTNKTINDSTNSIGDANTYVHDLTVVPNQTGGWTEYFVTTTPVTTTGQALVDITGLVTGTLSNSTLYEFDVHLFTSTSADTTGAQYGIHGAGTGTAATVEASAWGTQAQGGQIQYTIRQVDTVGSTHMTTASTQGDIKMCGWFTSTSTGTATMSVQHLKVTSGTSTVKVGSVLRIRKAHT